MSTSHDRRSRRPAGAPDGGQFTRRERREAELAFSDDQGTSDLQEQLARDFFALPESRGFVFTDGAALIAHGVVARLTDDLDLFTHRGAGDVGAAADALQQLVEGRGGQVTRAHDYDTFVRMLIETEAGEELRVDISLDAPPITESTITALGPTVSLEENAAGKLLALFGRAEARDFVDVYALHQRFTKEELLNLAAERDEGFDAGVFAQMVQMLDRVADQDLPIVASQIADLRGFFAAWAAELVGE